METLDYWLVGGYLLLILALGLNAGRKVNSLRQFAIAGGNYGTLVVFATLSASYIGGGFTMGNAGVVYTIGLVNVAAIWGFSLKEILVGWFLAPRMRRFPDALSAGDITGQAYGREAKILTGVLGIIVCVAIVGAQVGAMGTVFQVFLGVEPIWGVLAGCTILIVYSTFGGMRAVVVTDLVQFALLAIGLPLVLVMGVMALGGVESTLEAIPPEHFDLFSNKTVIEFISLFFVLFMGEALVPPYLQRLMIGNPRKVAMGTILSGIFSIPFFLITGCIGLVALGLVDELTHGNLAIPTVVNQVLPIGIKGLVIAGIISISMSSADSFLNSAAVCFSHDIVKPIVKGKPLTDREELFMARIVTATGGVISVIVAMMIPGLLDILLFAYNFWAPLVLPALVAAFFGWQAPGRVFIAAAGVGLLANLLWTYSDIGLSPTFGLWGNIDQLDGMIIGVLSNLVVLLIGLKTLGTRKAG